MATKEAIGKMTQDAMNRIEAAMALLVERFGIEPLDMGSILFRDPAYQWAARLTALAEWVESLNAGLNQAGFDMTGAQQTSDNLDLIRVVLDQALNGLTKRELETIVADRLALEFHGTIKQEYVNVIVAELTGKPIETISLNDLEDQEASPDAPDAESDAEQADDVPDDDNEPEEVETDG